jgi:hypothetical protein
MSVKKEASGSRSASVKAEVPAGGQSEEERQSAEASLNALISRFAPAHLGLVAEMRRLLRKRLPTAHEIAYEYRDWFVISYSPSERGYEGVIAIRGSADGIKLYLSRGKELPDPDKLLKGTAQTRFIHVEDASKLDSPAVSSLIDEAIARSPVPFASDGRGSVVLRSASGRQPKSTG